MLWFVSGILLLRFIWFDRPKEQRVYISCFYGMGVIFEFLQLSKKVPGTFDLLDLLCMGIGAFVEGLLYNLFIRRRQK
jgi:xanthine/uracil permease